MNPRVAAGWRASRYMAQAEQWRRRAERETEGTDKALEAWRRANFYTRKAIEAVKEMRGVEDEH